MDSFPARKLVLLARGSSKNYCHRDRGKARGMHERMFLVGSSFCCLGRTRPRMDLLHIRLASAHVPLFAVGSPFKSARGLWAKRTGETSRAS